MTTKMASGTQGSLFCNLRCYIFHFELASIAQANDLDPVRMFRNRLSNVTSSLAYPAENLLVAGAATRSCASKVRFYACARPFAIIARNILTPKRQAAVDSFVSDRVVPHKCDVRSSWFVKLPKYSLRMVRRKHYIRPIWNIASNFVS